LACEAKGEDGGEFGFVRVVAGGGVERQALEEEYVARLQRSVDDLGRGISLDVAAVERKQVQHRRGGCSFEQNSLLMCALRDWIAEPV
jgi:hypothetical protein